LAVIDCQNRFYPQYDEIPQEKYKDHKIMAIKDHYTFDFLELSEKHSERELALPSPEQFERGMAFLTDKGND
jgi:hypothetical protein